MPLTISPVAPLPANHGRNAATGEHTLAALHGLQPGIYTARDLYARYISLCDEQQVTPAPSNYFGRQLSTLGIRRTKTDAGTTRCWIIPAS